MTSKWWVFYVPGDPDHWQDPEYVAEVGAAEDLSEDGGWWTCNAETIKGDRALLYAKTPISAIVAILEATSPAREQENEYSIHPWVCDFKCIAVFDQQITLRELREDAEIYKQWSLVRANFQAPGGKSPSVSGSALRLLADRFPQVKSYL